MPAREAKPEAAGGVAGGVDAVAVQSDAVAPTGRPSAVVVFFRLPELIGIALGQVDDGQVPVAGGVGHGLRQYGDVLDGAIIGPPVLDEFHVHAWGVLVSEEDGDRPLMHGDVHVCALLVFQDEALDHGV